LAPKSSHLALWGFKVNLTRGARRKFVVLVSDVVIEHLVSEDAEIGPGYAHRQLFVEDYCLVLGEGIVLSFSDRERRL